MFNFIGPTLNLFRTTGGGVERVSPHFELTDKKNIRSNF